MSTAAASGFLYEAGLRFCGECLIIENMERGEADIRDFLVAESEEVRRHDVARRYIRERSLA
jgi:hypothetical protein